MKTTVGGVLNLARNVLLVVLLLFAASAADGGTMYKYRGADGEWIYTDRKPEADKNAEVRDLEATFVRPEFSVVSEVVGSAVEFVAHNEFYAPIEVRLEFEDIVGVEMPNSDDRLRWVIDPRSDQVLLNLNILPGAATTSVRYRFEFLPGNPTARHEPDNIYRAPFSVGRSFPITQAYPDVVTHRTAESARAVDIAMPIGTDILAARDGVVFDVASQNYKGGLNLDRTGYGDEANLVRILHDDGTFSLYAHLNWNTIRVKPGDRVRAGQYIADSGNTGFSSGPHLHFSVQRNVGLRVESVPVVFKGATATPVVPASGNVLTGHY